jgi:hypothetical protein
MRRPDGQRRPPGRRLIQLLVGASQDDGSSPSERPQGTIDSKS